jgi:hypothetical protein
MKKKTHKKSKTDINKISVARKFFNTKVFVGPSLVGGRGVYAAVDFDKGDIIEIAPAIRINRNANLIQHTNLEYYVFASEEEGTQLLALGYASMYNHKQIPSAEFHVLDDMVIITAKKSIEAGDEIFVNYGWDDDTLAAAGVE